MRKGLGRRGWHGWHGKTQHSQQFRNRRFGWCDRVCARGAEYKIARACRSSRRGDENKKKLTVTIPLKIAGGLLEGGLRVCVQGEMGLNVSLRAMERTRLRRPYSKKSRGRILLSESFSQSPAKLEIAQRISPPSGGLVLILIRTAQGSRMPPERSTGGAKPSSFVAHRTTRAAIPAHTYVMKGI